MLINPSVPSVLYIGRSAKILISRLEGIIKKISYECCDYESVDEKSYVTKNYERKNPSTNGLNSIK